ncbi:MULTISPECIES: L7Ae/L30e/S12e/Gadd45 family ribosomal protein [Kyrpidia]|uniref:Ribosomal protein L7Ae n=1 Tax=Kyrpidia spormannii TaxID=2055160 RepID=A0ACA8Z8R0_9BACL|nr:MULTISPECIES: ribosomal L7Ae/L30e/S12e/Gadd45 family protein [Kyrpidia]CAB3392428.1 Ribosomal protein L7Ae [Kyrpidia spormannii]HHY68137.1 50S ribosomal protein L7ae [Alicyclobacillus sp.]
MGEPRTLGLVGLALRAGCLALGERAVLERIRRGGAHLVLLATDAGPNTRKRTVDKCRSHGVPWAAWVDRYTLGKAVGRETVVVAAVTEQGFAENLLTQLRQHHGGDRFESETPSVRIRQTTEYVEQGNYNHLKTPRGVGQQPHERDGPGDD